LERVTRVLSDCQQGRQSIGSETAVQLCPQFQVRLSWTSGCTSRDMPA
jgi:hypothetical protein